jgi:hypothetical protein
MITLNKIESKYFDLVENRISITAFKNWINQSEWLQDELTEDEYLDLIILNYNQKVIYIKDEVKNILKERINEGKVETIKMLNYLNSIIERDGKEGIALIKMYDLYCAGYYFLEELGLHIGLQIIIARGYEVDSYDELNEKQQKALVNSTYPSAQKLAKEVKNSLLAGDLKLTGEQDEKLNHWEFIDNRTENDKKSKL